MSHGSSEQLAVIGSVLDKIDSDNIAPSIPGPIGRFLRQYRVARSELDAVLVASGAERRGDGAVSGRLIGEIEIHPLYPAEPAVLSRQLGEVAETLSISEELGGLVRTRLWLKAPIANATLNALRSHGTASLRSDFRWTPPSTLTPGEAEIGAPLPTPLGWRTARCLKAVADDVLRPAHALEYSLDFRVGPPGLKHFRTVCVKREGSEWRVVPALAHPKILPVKAILSRASTSLRNAEYALLLIYCEPWSPRWIVAEAAPVDSRRALEHVITWADFQREIDDAGFDAELYRALSGALRDGDASPQGIRPSGTRRLLPVPRLVQRWLRGRV